ncbi:sn-glycerol-3-phosphate ABC transporter substrate-binding protein UgpB [Desulfoluna sp.]|uniref:sn-glycerol-3-phosphate ABC transporter substrate-binding protein UgpB n=1 Tax=Desulfoluna sp. TaxID=2045199 RepID=UPI00261E089B|nr:sn-glycerol-3-phosphate ABC transporter substrate-binding protein UgpB [Desulfoluna sp.]
MVLRKWVASITAALILAPAAAMAKPVTIQWWHAMRSARGEVANEIIKRFNESQDQYKVEGSFKGNYDETLNAGIAAFRAKKQPHLMQVFEVGTQTMMLSGAIYPVFQLMKDTGNDIDWSRYLQPILSYYMNADGNLVSMPFNSSTPVMYYNKALFKKAGIDTIPVTWDDMGVATKKLRDAGVGAGMVTAWQSWVQVENYSAIHNIPFATLSNGYEGLDVELTINNPQMVKHITRLKEWAKDGRFVYSGQKYQGPKAEFLAQNAGIYMDSISGIAKLKKAAQFDWGVAPLPVEADMKNPQNSIIGGASLWVFKGKSKKEYKAVAAFLKFLSTNEIQEYWHKETGYFPTTIDAYESLKAKGYYKADPKQEVGITQLKRRDPTKISRGLRLGSFTQIRNIINEELELVWNGNKTPQEALDSAVKRSNIKLKSFAKTYKKRS